MPTAHRPSPIAQNKRPLKMRGRFLITQTMLIVIFFLLFLVFIFILVMVVVMFHFLFG